jgi:Large polyvalent protein-associated domain 7/Relaxase/Mobilisation nuclease domain
MSESSQSLMVAFDVRAFVASRRGAVAWASSSTPMLPGVSEASSVAASMNAAAGPRGSAETASMIPSTGFIVASGVGAIAPPEDDELFRRAPGSGGAGVDRVGGATLFGDVSRFRAQCSEVRSPTDKTRALATGSQAAVVKLASFASGRRRMGALVRYQSREGEIPLEREDGSKVEGMAALNTLVAQWAKETPSQEPSKDVMSFTTTLAEALESEAVQAALGRALAGHRFAWRVEEGEGKTLVHVVTSAASTRRDGDGRSQRIFDNNKSVAALHDRLDAAFGADVELKERGWGHGVDGAARHLHRLTGDGKKAGLASVGRILDSHEANLEEANSWKRSLRSREPRDTAHIILSAKAGTSQEAFVDAARATLAREFAGHKYAFALHTDKRHIHVHAIVRMDNSEGKRLHPGIGDFRHWRETLAEEARRRHIPMEEIRRFQQANTPAYKLKDVGMAERNEATEAQHKRLEAAGRAWNHAKGGWERTERGVHIPSRAEGRRRAHASAHQWRAIGESSRFAPEPPLSSEALRLYRVEKSMGPQRATPLFTSDRTKAEALVVSFNAKLFYVDVPRSRLDEVKPSRSDPATMFVVSASLNAEHREIVRADDDKIRILATERARRAALESTGAEISKLGRILEDPVMRTVETLTAARASLEALFNEALPLLVEGDQQGWVKQKTDMLAATDRLIEINRRVDVDRAEIRGAGYDAPQPRDVGTAFTSELMDGEVRYSRSGATGRREIAFVDKGDRIEIRDWTSREIVLAAMTIAAQKWGAIEVDGAEGYKTSVVDLAAEYGLTIANPELQDIFRAAQSSLVARGANGKTSIEGGAAASPLLRTLAETQVALDQVQHATEREAARETRQAIEARRLAETTPASGTAEHPYRSAQEARSARDAARAIENNPDRPTPTEPGQSQKIQELTREQRTYLEQARTFNEEEVVARARRDEKDKPDEDGR